MPKRKTPRTSGASAKAGRSARPGKSANARAKAGPNARLADKPTRVPGTKARGKFRPGATPDGRAFAVSEGLFAEREAPLPPYPVVGIGASAGGLEAVTQLLQALPKAPGVALVLVQHLASDQESRLPDLLAAVSPLPVVAA